MCDRNRLILLSKQDNGVLMVWWLVRQNKMEDHLKLWILKPVHFEFVESTQHEFLILGLIFNYFL